VVFQAILKKTLQYNKRINHSKGYDRGPVGRRHVALDAITGPSWQLSIVASSQLLVATRCFPQPLHRIYTMYPQLIAEFIQKEQLPATYQEDAERWFVPLAKLLIQEIQTGDKALIVGINGAQGTGKSTLAALLQHLLQASGLNTVSLSVDDFYYSKSHRRQMALDVHPLLACRGVPGTHDVRLALTTLDRLLRCQPGETLSLPAFNKATDDCCLPEQQPTVTGPVRCIILEGWFIGATPQSATALEQPLNSLESEEDANGKWRRYVNQQLAGEYQQLFARLDKLVMLRAPGFEQVMEWRCLQEDKLRERATGNAMMSEAQIARFIQHFERLTCHCLNTLPAQADISFDLDIHHRITSQVTN